MPLDISQLCGLALPRDAQVIADLPPPDSTVLRGVTRHQLRRLAGAFFERLIDLLFGDVGVEPSRAPRKRRYAELKERRALWNYVLLVLATYFDYAVMRLLASPNRRGMLPGIDLVATSKLEEAWSRSAQPLYKQTAVRFVAAYVACYQASYFLHSFQRDSYGPLDRHLGEFERIAHHTIGTMHTCRVAMRDRPQKVMADVLLRSSLAHLLQIYSERAAAEN